MTEPAKDARGVEITDGATCIYGASVGRSIALVEGVTDGFTASGRVWVKIVRRAYGGGWIDSKERVHVGANRLVVVDALPACDLPTQAEAVTESLKANVARYLASVAGLEAGEPVDSMWESREEALSWYRARLAELEAKA